MSLEVISRLTGGPNLMPLLSRNVHVLPPFVGLGMAVARSGTGTPPAVPTTWLYPTRVRPSRFV